MNVVLLVMKAGDRIEEPAAPGPSSPNVREGRIRFVVAEEEVAETGSDTLLTCGAGVRQAVEALSDAVPARYRRVASLSQGSASGKEPPTSKLC